jgi:hypothetical protein
MICPSGMGYEVLWAPSYKGFTDGGCYVDFASFSVHVPVIYN